MCVMPAPTKQGAKARRRCEAAVAYGGLGGPRGEGGGGIAPGGGRLRFAVMMPATVAGQALAGGRWVGNTGVELPGMKV